MATWNRQARHGKGEPVVFFRSDRKTLGSYGWVGSLHGTTKELEKNEYKKSGRYLKALCPVERF